MEHPEIQPVCLQALELRRKHLECDLLVGSGVGLFERLAMVNTDLGHDKGLVAPASRQRHSHPFLGTAIVVFPAVIEEIHTLIDSIMGDTGCILHRRSQSERVPAEPNAAQCFLMPPKDSSRHRPRRYLSRAY